MTVATAPQRNEAGEETRGFVTSSIREGEVFLLGPERKRYRLSWNATDRRRERALPVGRYRVTGYRIARKDKKDIPWFVSTTSKGYRPLRVLTGKTTRLDIDPTIRFKVRAVADGKKITAGGGLSGEGNPSLRVGVKHVPRVGLSIYRDGKRIPLPYRFLDADGKEIGKGVLEYG